MKVDMIATRDIWIAERAKTVGMAQAIIDWEDAKDRLAIMLAHGSERA